MNKTIHFLGGLPRAGATLLSSILNQNPNIHSTLQTRLFQDMFYLHESQNISPYENSNYSNIIDAYPYLFYKNIKASIILDKNHNWGIKNSLDIQNKISPNGKNIILFRPICEVLASFLRICKTNPNNFIDKALIEQNQLVNDENRCEWLMSPSGDICRGMDAVIEARKSINKDSHIIIVYDDLVQNMPMVFNNLYNFLNLEPFTHDNTTINNINNTKRDNLLFGVENLHTLKPHLSNANKSYLDIVPKSIYQKYKDWY